MKKSLVRKLSLFVGGWVLLGSALIAGFFAETTIQVVLTVGMLTSATMCMVGFVVLQAVEG